MALSKQDREDIKAAIAEAIQDSNCACGLSPEAQGEVCHLMGMVKDLGNGNRGAGIEAMRDIFKWWAKVRIVGEKIGMAIIMAAVTFVVGGIGAVLWLGVKVKVGK